MGSEVSLIGLQRSQRSSHAVPPLRAQAEKQASRKAAADANRLLRQRQKGADPAQAHAPALHCPPLRLYYY